MTHDFLKNQMIIPIEPLPWELARTFIFPLYLFNKMNNSIGLCYESKQNPSLIYNIDDYRRFVINNGELPQFSENNNIINPLNLEERVQKKEIDLFVLPLVHPQKLNKITKELNEEIISANDYYFCFDLKRFSPLSLNALRYLSFSKNEFFLKYFENSTNFKSIKNWIEESRKKNPVLIEKIENYFNIK